MTFLIDLKAPAKSRPAAPPDGARDMSALDERQRYEMQVLDACAFRLSMAQWMHAALEERHERLKQKLDRYQDDPVHGMGTPKFDEAERRRWSLHDQIVEMERAIDAEIVRSMQAWERVGTVGQAMVGVTWGAPAGMDAREFSRWLDRETQAGPMPMVEAPF